MNVYEGLRLPKERVYVREASLTKRAISFLTDLFILDFFVYGSYTVFLTHPSFINPSPSLTAAAVTMSLIALAYFSLFEWVLEQTPGMMLFNLKTENVTLAKSFLRNIYFLPLFPFPLLLIVEPIYLVWQKRRWLEILTKTRTIERIRY